MRAGKMDRRIIIQRATVTQDDHGEPIETWATLDTVWAQYLPGGGDERYSGQQVFAETQCRFRIRHRAGIKPTDRVSYEGREYDILAVDPIGRREGLEIKAKARAE
jgi:SPP1 family predicted phage head-tail adaptor